MINAAITDWIIAFIAMIALTILGVIGSSWKDVAGVATLLFFISGTGHLIAALITEFIREHR